MPEQVELWKRCDDSMSGTRRVVPVGASFFITPAHAYTLRVAGVTRFRLVNNELKDVHTVEVTQ